MTNTTAAPATNKRPDGDRTDTARTATIERKAARVAKRFIVGGAK